MNLSVAYKDRIFELNSKSIALNILYLSHNTEEIRHPYKSTYNLKREKTSYSLNDY